MTRCPSPPAAAFLRQRPGHTHDHFAFAEAPEIHTHADDVVESRIGALIKQQRGERAERIDEQSSLDAPVHGRQQRHEFGRVWSHDGRGYGGGVAVMFLVAVAVGCDSVRVGVAS